MVSMNCQLQLISHGLISFGCSQLWLRMDLQVVIRRFRASFVTAKTLTRDSPSDNLDQSDTPVSMRMPDIKSILHMRD